MGNILHKKSKDKKQKDLKIKMLEKKIKYLENIKDTAPELEDLYDYSKKNDIILIPLVKRYNLENLYPVEDEVEKWNIFIVGNDKTYIQAKAPDFSKNIKEDEMLNTKGKSYMEERIFNFLDRIWDKTLNGQQIQIFVYTFRTLYLLNSYALRNTDNNEIIGAICFMRDAGLVDKDVFDINVNDKDNNFVDAFTKRKYNEIELENKYLNIKQLNRELIGKEEVNENNWWDKERSWTTLKYNNLLFTFRYFRILPLILLIKNQNINIKTKEINNIKKQMDRTYHYYFINSKFLNSKFLNSK